MRRLTRAGVTLAALAMSMAPATAALAHSDIVDHVPADGATVTTQEVELVATFTEELDPSSSLTVIDANGEALPTESRLDLDDLDHLRLIGSATLEPGHYTVEWVSVSADDGDSEEGNWTFGVAGADGVVPDNGNTAPVDSGAPLPAAIAVGILVVVGGAFAVRRRVGTSA